MFFSDCSEYGFIVVSAISVGEWVVPSTEFLIDAGTWFNDIELSVDDIRIVFTVVNLGWALRLFVLELEKV